MLAAVDIGNSNIVFGVYQEDRLVFSFRISTQHKATVDEYGLKLSQLFKLHGSFREKLKFVLISSVVPQLESVFREAFEKYFSVVPKFVLKEVSVDMPLLVEKPNEVGADRLVNAYAAFHKYRQGLILVDMGTATTFDVVDQNGGYLGGAIAPGVEIASDALFRLTSKIPQVALKKPASVIGRDTMSAVQSGIFLGNVGLIDSIVSRMRKEVKASVRVIATGGLAKLFASESEEIDGVEANLTLEGLSLIHQKSMNKI